MSPFVQNGIFFRIFILQKNMFKKLFDNNKTNGVDFDIGIRFIETEIVEKIRKYIHHISIIKKKIFSDTNFHLQLILQIFFPLGNGDLLKERSNGLWFLKSFKTKTSCNFGKSLYETWHVYTNFLLCWFSEKLYWHTYHLSCLAQESWKFLMWNVLPEIINTKKLFYPLAFAQMLILGKYPTQGVGVKVLLLESIRFLFLLGNTICNATKCNTAWIALNFCRKMMFDSLWFRGKKQITKENLIQDHI